MKTTKIYRQIFLDKLPRHTKGKQKGNIDWVASIDYNVKFIYGDIKGVITILDYDKKLRNIKFRYKNITYSLHISDIHRCRLGIALGIHTVNSFKYKEEDIVETKTGKLKILKQINRKDSRNKEKSYVYECMNCGYSNEKTEKSLIRKTGCFVCSGRETETINISNPELSKLLANIEDGYKYTQGSDTKIGWKCQQCGNIFKKEPCYVKETGAFCENCTNGMSYPERFMYNLLKQLDENFIYQKSFKWSRKKRYDFYLIDKNIIIEVHGGQHYSNSYRFGSVKTLEDEQKNDSYKEKLAKENHIDDYIIIDARKSSKTFIKNNIINSQLSIMYNLSLIDWRQIHTDSLKSLAREIFNLYELGVKKDEISKTMRLGRRTINNYINLFKDTTNNKKATNRRKIILINNAEIFSSLSDASKKYNIGVSHIINCCKGIRKSAGKHPITGEKLKWMYYEDYIAQQNKQEAL